MCRILATVLVISSTPFRYTGLLQTTEMGRFFMKQEPWNLTRGRSRFSWAQVGNPLNLGARVNLPNFLEKIFRYRSDRAVQKITRVWCRKRFSPCSQMLRICPRGERKPLSPRWIERNCTALESHLLDSSKSHFLTRMMSGFLIILADASASVT
jgi:hypothetical protein